MATIVIELTNRCNLRCRHCSEQRHSSGSDLKMDVIEKILENAGDYGFDHLSFTGGEPTLHPQFEEILRIVYRHEYDFSFVSNGWNFSGIYEKIVPYQDRLAGITFSLDGATENVHDALRGKESYLRVMKAISICVVKKFPFTINTVITPQNYMELGEIANVVSALGAGGLRFGHLISNPHNALQNLDLSPIERKKTDTVIQKIQKSSLMPIAIAPGYYTASLFPCNPLNMKEMNIDLVGNVTKCCHLSGYGEDAGKEDVIGDLSDISFSEAYERLAQGNRKFREDKAEHKLSGNFKDTDNFSCWYCLNYFNKLGWLLNFNDNPWSDLVWQRFNKEEKINERA